MDNDDSDRQGRRYIFEYCAKSEELLAGYQLDTFDLERFQDEFNKPDSDELMYYCYPIHRKNIDFLSDYVSVLPDWDFENKSYFLEAVST